MKRINKLINILIILIAISFAITSIIMFNKQFYTSGFCFMYCAIISIYTLFVKTEIEKMNKLLTD